MKCPKCGNASINFATERSPDGKTKCLDCGYENKHHYFRPVKVCPDPAKPNSELAVQTITRPIEWHKCSEKMPEIGDEIVLFREYKVGDCIYLFKIHNEFDRDHLYGYWAHVSAFNFPKGGDK